MLYEMESVTVLLARWRTGDRSALDELLPLVYGELKRLAEDQLRNDRPGHTLRATALVHEAYLRLANSKAPDIQDRAHFRGFAARVMRNVLVDYARARASQKRGGGLQVSLENSEEPAFSQPAALVAIDDALTRLAETQKELAEIVEMRFFAGMTAEEISEFSGRSVHTVRHDTRLAMAWLRKELSS